MAGAGSTIVTSLASGGGVAIVAWFGARLSKRYRSTVDGANLQHAMVEWYEGTKGGPFKRAVRGFKEQWPELQATVADHGIMLERVTKLLLEIKEMLRPNGLDSNNPGDVAKRSELLSRKIAQGLGIEVDDVPDP